MDSGAKILQFPDRSYTWWVGIPLLGLNVKPDQSGDILIELADVLAEASLKFHALAAYAETVRIDFNSTIEMMQGQPLVVFKFTGPASCRSFIEDQGWIAEEVEDV